jgi:hypothetical protein
MSIPGTPRSERAAILDRSGHELEVEDTFETSSLDGRLWIPAYLPQWSSTAAAAARYEVGGGSLRLRIDRDQAPWCPECDGELRVSSLQTGVFSGPLGSSVGQHRFRDGLIVREAQAPAALYTPTYGLFEMRLRALDDPAAMVALWMIGYEDQPEHSAEICIAEIFGRDVGEHGAAVGMGVHPHHDPDVHDDFERVRLDIDVRKAHDYVALWTPQLIAFYVDERLVKVVDQSPGYAMQLMLSVFDFRGDDWPVSPPERYPKTFVVERFRGHRPTTGPGVRTSAFPGYRDVDQ